MKSLAVRYWKHASLAAAVAAVGILCYWSIWFRIPFAVLFNMACGVGGAMLLFPKFFKRKASWANVGILTACLVLGLVTLLVVAFRGFPPQEDRRSFA